MRKSNRTKFDQLLDRFDPIIRTAFTTAIYDIRSSVVLGQLVDRLERGDIEGALEALNVNRTAFGALERAIDEAYSEGGMTFAHDLRLRDVNGNRIAFWFGVRDLIAERYLSQHGATLVTHIAEDARRGIRTHLADGLAQGRNPKSTALEVIGRYSRATGRRTGGIIGLTDHLTQTVSKARMGLAAGDVQAMRAYMALKSRDKRFDRTVLKAIADDKPLSSAMVDRITGRLADGYLKLRGNTLALHETFTALAQSKHDGLRQAMQSGKVDVRFVFKKWFHSGKEHYRDQHLAMSGTEMRFGEDFVMADGTRLPFPHSPNAPAKHTVGCGCRVEYRIDYTAQMIERRRFA